MFMTMHNDHLWYVVFMLISLDQSTKALELIEFPQQIDLNILRDTSREVIERYVQSKPRRVKRDEIEAFIPEFWENVRITLTERLAAEQVKQFYAWLDLFSLDADLDKSISMIGTFYLRPLIKNPDDIANLSPESRERIITTLQAYKSELSAVLRIVDLTEESPRTEWEERAIEIYNGGEDYSPDRAMWTTPYDYVVAIFTLINLPRWIREMQTSLPKADFDALNTYIEEKLQSKKHTLRYGNLYAILQNVSSV